MLVPTDWQQEVQHQSRAKLNLSNKPKAINEVEVDDDGDDDDDDNGDDNDNQTKRCHR